MAYYGKNSNSGGSGTTKNIKLLPKIMLVASAAAIIGMLILWSTEYIFYFTFCRQLSLYRGQ
jgi:hypothetical protein